MGMNNLSKYYEMHKNIQRSPYSFLSSLSLEHLRIFLLGYDACALDNKVYFSWKPEFNNFIENKYKDKLISRHPFKIIELCESNEKDAFNKFFELLDDFLEKYVCPSEIVENALPSEYEKLSLTDKYYKALDMIRKKPKLYFRSTSLQYLESYINGYTACANTYQISFSPHHGFDDFIQEKYEAKVSKNPFKIIHLNSFYDEEAFNKFFELLDEFLKQKETPSD